MLFFLFERALQFLKHLIYELGLGEDNLEICWIKLFPPVQIIHQNKKKNLSDLPISFLISDWAWFFLHDTGYQVIKTN